MTPDNLTSASPPSDQQLPGSPEDVLERAGDQRRLIFRLVRDLLDEAEEIAPWSRLYCFPDNHREFVQMATTLVELLEDAPRRVEELLTRLRSESGDLDSQALEDVEFFFGGIHGMVRQDVTRLKAKINEVDAEGEAASTEARAYLGEITADLKGKYSSAIMGATASIVGEGIWDGVEIEPLLFPEKEEEFRRNEQLANALDEVLKGIEELPKEVPFSDLVTHWDRGERLDQYVLADLDRLKSKLGMLLKRSSRRALYAGDYHQIHRRENLLTNRINELEKLHRSTWADSSADGAEPECYRRLVQLTLEVAALVDVDILEELIGERQCKDLRSAVVTALSTPEGKKAGRSLPPHLQSLMPLLADDDLKTFFGILQGSVRKRLSLTAVLKAEVMVRGDAEAASDDEQPEELALEPLEEPSEELLGPIDAGEPLNAAEPLGAGESLDAGEPNDAGLASEEEEARLRPAEKWAGLRTLHDTFRSLRSSSNSSWQGFVMIERLLSKHGRIPPSMFALAHPFFDEVLEELVPQLETVLPFTDIPPEKVRSLADCSRFLRHCDPSPGELKQRIPAVLGKLGKLLSELEATAAELSVLHSVS